MIKKQGKKERACVGKVFFIHEFFVRVVERESPPAPPFLQLLHSSTSLQDHNGRMGLDSPAVGRKMF